MQQFTIRDIENLTGIKAHTLRIWEQRYGFFTARRKESLHRIYDNEDLKKLLRVSFLYHQGWKISRIAGLSQQQVIDEVVSTTVHEKNVEGFVNTLLEACLDFDEASFRQIMDNAAEKLGFEKLIVDVCYPFLKKLGLLWSSNHLIPAQEHFSSYLIQNRVIRETDTIPLPGNSAEILLICPQGEFHELPLLFINYLLRKNGCPTLYMGANIHNSELTSLQAVASVKNIYLHLITNFTGSTVDEYLEGLCRQFPQLNIYASGEGVRNVQRTFTNLKLLRTDREIYAFIESLKPAPARVS